MSKSEPGKSLIIELQAEGMAKSSHPLLLAQINSSLAAIHKLRNDEMLPQLRQHWNARKNQLDFSVSLMLGTYQLDAAHLCARCLFNHRSAW